MFDRQQPTALVYVAPALFFTVILSLAPTIYALYLAFTNYSIFHFEDYTFVGLRNFVRIFTGYESGTFVAVFGWTLIWATISVAGSVLIGLALALILNQPGLQGKNLYRTLFIVPWAIPAFISVMMWQGLLNTRFGSINMIFKPLFEKLAEFTSLIPATGEIDWLLDPFWARVAVLIVNLWLAFPFMMTVILGALQSIPRDLYEAASVDGAGAVRQFFSITIPQLRSALLPVLISSFAFNFNQFGGIYLLTSGGPAQPGTTAGATDILVTYSYKLAFEQFLFGSACAYAVIVFLVVGSLSSINFKLSRAFDEV